MKDCFIIVLFVLSFFLISCHEAAENKGKIVDNKDIEYLNVADSVALCQMSLGDKLRVIDVYKIAEHIDLNLVDSVYTLTLSLEDAKKMGVDKCHYKEVVTSLNQLNEWIAVYNRHHAPNESLELTDFKQLIQERKNP